jgi:hypothetical protein
MDVFNVIAGCASIVGLLLTFFGLLLTFSVWRRVKDIERRFRRQALVPHFHGKLVAFVKNLRRHERDKNSEGIREMLVVCRTTLHDLTPYLDDQRKERTARVIETIDEILPKPNDPLWRQSSLIIAEVHGLTESLDTQMNEMKWSGTNA